MIISLCSIDIYCGEQDETSERSIAVSSHIPRILDSFDAVMPCYDSQAFPENLLPPLIKPDRHLNQAIAFHFQAGKTRNSQGDADPEKNHNGAQGERLVTGRGKGSECMRRRQ